MKLGPSRPASQPIGDGSSGPILLAVPKPAANLISILVSPSPTQTAMAHRLAVGLVARFWPIDCLGRCLDPLER